MEEVSAAHMLAALALSGLADACAAPSRSESELDDDDDAEYKSDPGDVRALDIGALPDESDQWPYSSGKGWFAKNPRGAEIHFLERIFLMLSFGSLRLRKTPSRTVRETIRWLSPEAAARCLVPEGVAAFEIVNVELFEREMYPQYASGSFNKTAGKWCLVSPSGALTAASSVRKLSRTCMFLPPAVDVDGLRCELDSARVFRPLPAETQVSQVYEYAARFIRSLQEGRVRQVYRLREDSDRRRKLGLALSRTPTPTPPASMAAVADAADGDIDPEVELLTADAALRERLEAEAVRAELRRRVAACYAHAHAGGGARALAGADSRCAQQAQEAVAAYSRTHTPVAPACARAQQQLSFVTPLQQSSGPTSPEPDSLELRRAADVHRAAALALACAAHGRAAGAGAAFALHSPSPGPEAGQEHESAQDWVQGSGHDSRGLLADESLDAEEAALRAGGAARWPLSRCSPPQLHPLLLDSAGSAERSGSSGAHTPRPAHALELQQRLRLAPPDLRPPPLGHHGGATARLVAPLATPASGSLRPVPSAAPRLAQRASSERSLGRSAAGAGCGLPLPLASARAPGHSGDSEAQQAQPQPEARDSSSVFPFAPGKGWFAFSKAGKSVFFLERLFQLLAHPHAPLRTQPGAVLGDVIRWIDADHAAALGVPEGESAFEVSSTELFEREVYPQFRSGSFRKTAKHWGVLSPQPGGGALKAGKLSVRCMFVPAERSLDPHAQRLEPRRVFRPSEPTWCEEQIEAYLHAHIRPLEERVRSALLSATREHSAQAKVGKEPPKKRARRASGTGGPPLSRARSNHL